VPQNAYDEILYESSARFATHPDRLAAIARLFGMDPAPLGDAYPRSLTFAGLIPYGGSEAALRGILTGMVLSGFADFHVYCFPCHQGVSAKPAASRRHATRRSTRTPWLTLASASWRWTRSAATWCPLLDGSRTHRQIAEELARLPGAPSLEKSRGNCLPIWNTSPTRLCWKASRTFEIRQGMKCVNGHFQACARLSACGGHRRLIAAGRHRNLESELADRGAVLSHRL
jgi:hypothetical protein